jgi:tripartite-type tricarboxylate transporter receptor subunit TctC
MENPTRRVISRALSALLMTVTFSSLANADPVADFYRGKIITINVGYGAGGGYDTMSRFFARHIGNHIPGKPTVVIQNMPGSGSMIAANHLYNIAPKDGTVLGVFASSTALEPLFGNEQAKFQTDKFEWIGSLDKDVNACAVWKGAGQNITTLPDLIAAKKTVTFGASSPAASSSQHAIFLKKMFNANLKVITGYEGTNGVKLAMERGEVDAACGLQANSVKSTYMQEVQRGDMQFFVQFGGEPVPLFGKATLMYDMVKPGDDRLIADLIFRQTELSKPFAAPPGTPKERVAAIRKALIDTTKDPAMIAEAEKMGLELSTIPGEEMAQMFAEFLKVPPALAKKAAEYTQPD